MESGEFLWNSGIFIWSLKSILKAFHKHLPEIDDLFKKGKDKYYTDQESKFIKDTYTVCKSISIDYGVMEKAGKCLCHRIGFRLVGPGHLGLASRNPQ